MALSKQFEMLKLKKDKLIKINLILNTEKKEDGKECG